MVIRINLVADVMYRFNGLNTVDGMVTRLNFLETAVEIKKMSMRLLQFCGFFQVAVGFL